MFFVYIFGWDTHRIRLFQVVWFDRIIVDLNSDDLLRTIRGVRIKYLHFFKDITIKLVSSFLKAEYISNNGGNAKLKFLKKHNLRSDLFIAFSDRKPSSGTLNRSPISSHNHEFWFHHIQTIIWKKEIFVKWKKKNQNYFFCEIEISFWSAQNFFDTYLC